MRDQPLAVGRDDGRLRLRCVAIGLVAVTEIFPGAGYR
jgi:hypothetical protein